MLPLMLITTRPTIPSTRKLTKKVCKQPTESVLVRPVSEPPAFQRHQKQDIPGLARPTVRILSPSATGAFCRLWPGAAPAHIPGDDLHVRVDAIRCHDRHEVELCLELAVHSTQVRCAACGIAHTTDLFMMIIKDCSVEMHGEMSLVSAPLPDSSICTLQVPVQKGTSIIVGMGVGVNVAMLGTGKILFDGKVS